MGEEDEVGQAVYAEVEKKVSIWRSDVVWLTSREVESVVEDALLTL